MILFVALLMSHLSLSVHGAAALERIDRCDTRCSQGLRCKTRLDNFFHPECETPPNGLSTSSIIQNISLSTVMRCEGRQKCFLHLRVGAAVQLTELIQGLSICTSTASLMSNCQVISFKNHRKSGLQVEVKHDCTEVSPGQHVKVMLKTVPRYCGIKWTGAYNAPECNTQDLKRHVPECITGKLSYTVNPHKKELNISVSDMLEDYDYHVRLCRKDFICARTGAHTLIKKEEPVKSLTFPYSRPLPCLCIEGWSAMTDAPRVQVCPFKDRVEELWFGINYDLQEEMLSWEPACPVTAVVVLCQKREEGVCVDLPHSSQNVSRAKVRFTKVDPHPQLCMKFTTGSQSWTSCPFADSRFQVWELSVTRSEGHDDVMMMSRITANFSVERCVRSEGSPECLINKTQIVHVKTDKAVGLGLTGGLCNTCIQVKRLNVRFAATISHCFGRCNETLPSILESVTVGASVHLSWVIVPIGVCLSVIIIVTLVLHVQLTVYQKGKRKSSGCASDKQTGAVNECAVPIMRPQTLIPESPSCGKTEKANLISV